MAISRYFIGTVKLPIGIAGPLRVNGLYAQGDYPLPLATSEAALVASYHRGACMISAAGGCTSMMIYQAPHHFHTDHSGMFRGHYSSVGLGCKGR